MQHIKAENVCDARGAERELLRVGDGVKPRAPDKVCRENVWRELLEKTWTRADFDRGTVWLSRSEQARKKLIIVHAPQNWFLLPNAAVPEKLLLGLRVDGHCAFFDCTYLGGSGACKARAIVSTGN